LLARAAQFLEAGRPADAIVPLREASLMQPANSLIQHDLGLACLEVAGAALAIRIELDRASPARRRA
jgi:hypothetical protein